MSRSILENIPTPYTVSLQGGDPEAKRAEIRSYFHQTFDVYERLFEPFRSQETFVTRADPLRHPLIFYYGHTAAFFMNKLVLGKFVRERVDARIERICAIGVDEMSWDDLNSAHYDWPHHTEIKAYRDRVRAVVDDLIQTAPITLPIGWESPFWVVLMGIEHERIHLETSSVLIRQLPLHLIDNEHPSWKVWTADHPAPANALLPVPGGRVIQGKSKNHRFYGWDNEYGHLETDVADFNASQYLVSNREYLEFIDAGGYSTPRWWTEEGWKWAQFDARGMPRFWRKDGNRFRLRVMLKEIPMPWSWPVETNYLEAKAFCNWKSEVTGLPIRLPSEPEWYRLLDYTETPDVESWKEAPGNINLEVCASSVPVDTFGFGHGFHDVIGNVWQHTETPIAAFPGFEVHPLYDDFSTPTFDTKHSLIKGGSWISTGNEATRDSRYAFRRHFYQHAGIRYVESAVPIVIRDDRFETDPDVTPMCELHYGPETPFGGASYPKTLAELCVSRMAGLPLKKAMELGCKVGRTAFELARSFDAVAAFDPTARMLRIGVELVEKGYTQWEIAKEGLIVDFRQAHLRDIGLEGVRSKVEFLQADLANMKELYCGFDLIIVNRLLENSYAPANFLKTVHERLNSRGILAVASTNDWNPSRTPRDAWLGGFKNANGENTTTLEGLQSLLAGHFTALGEAVDVPCVVRKTLRTYEASKVQVSFWQKRA